MNIRDLIDRLEEAAQDYGDDTEVLLMSQESWPFEYSVRGVTARAELTVLDEDVDELENAIFIVEGRQLRYGNKDAWNAV